MPTKHHYNGVGWASCKATTRPCKFVDATAKEIAANGEPDFTEGKSINNLRSDVHEFYVASEIVTKSAGAARFSVEEKQKAQYERRAASVIALRKERGAKQVDEIRNLALRTVSKLPTAVGEVLFTVHAANEGEVYDVIYTDTQGNRVAVSCKLSVVEDKAYRFSTNGYQLSTVNSYNRQIFPSALKDSGKSYEQVFAEKKTTVVQYQQHVSSLIVKLLTDENHGDHDVFVRLVKERFLGKGDYYRTTPSGDVRYFPAVKDEDAVSVDTSSVKLHSANTVVFTAVVNAGEKDEQRYALTFRVKFKDGQMKPVTFATNGVVNNVSAAVTLKKL